MIVLFRFEIDEEVNKALAYHNNKGHKCTQKDVRTWLRGIVNASLEDVIYDYNKAKGV